VQQVCAGYAIYGPAAMLVLTFGRGVHRFTLDRDIGEFVLTHPELAIPRETCEFAVAESPRGGLRCSRPLPHRATGNGAVSLPASYRVAYSLAGRVLAWCACRPKKPSPQGCRYGSLTTFEPRPAGQDFGVPDFGQYGYGHHD
jgi:hypothetical protein